jgi:hypothetical protein
MAAARTSGMWLVQMIRPLDLIAKIKWSDLRVLS